MRPQNNRRGGRRGGGSRRSHQSRTQTQAARSAAPQTLWQKIVAFFRPAPKSSSSAAKPRTTSSYPTVAPRSARPVEITEVTSEKLYIGNLSYDASESDLFELFKGVGAVRNAEVVTHKHNEKSKGFGFVTMATIDEARRAVVELHDKDFMGRKLVVSGARSPAREPNYRG